MYRYNYGMHHLLEGDDVILISGNQKITIHKANKIGLFLNHACKKVFVDQEDLRAYGITEGIFKLLLGYTALLEVSSFKSGVESLCLHLLASNPNKVDRDVMEEQLKSLYENSRDGLAGVINRTAFPKDNDLHFSEIESFPEMASLPLEKRFHSSRQSEKVEELDPAYLLAALKFINSKKEGKMTFGSGGGFYSVFQVVITAADQVYITDNKKELIYCGYFEGVYADLSQTILDDPEYGGAGYGAIVLVMSHTKNVLKKYGNRGYRFMMLESGSVGLLYRLLYSDRGYLELGGYYDSLVYENLAKYDFFNEMKDLLLTHFILLSH